MTKFVCMDCGGREVSGNGNAAADIQVDEEGKVIPSNLEWEHFENLRCDECEGDNILPIGTGRRFDQAM